MGIASVSVPQVEASVRAKARKAALSEVKVEVEDGVRVQAVAPEGEGGVRAAVRRNPVPIGCCPCAVVRRKAQSWSPAPCARYIQRGVLRTEAAQRTHTSRATQRDRCDIYVTSRPVVARLNFLL